MTDATPDVDGGDDPLRARLLDAAARVVAERGYDGTKIQHIVREAGLSTGAVYGRFTSKHDLLREAVISRSTPQVGRRPNDVRRVADLVAKGASRLEPGLRDTEALLLETYVTARREPQVAAALAEADERWREAVAPLVDAALHDGTVDADVDPDAVLFLLRALRVGMLLHRGSGLATPDPDAWQDLIARVVASFGRGETGVAPTSTAADPGTDQTVTTAATSPEEGTP